jgi:hypothetical protein
MRCPSCRQSLPEEAPACPHCQFNLVSAGHFFGQAPELEFPLTDLAGVLSPWKRRAVRDGLLAMSSSFPQLSFAAVLSESDARLPLAAHAFWLCNAGGLTAPQESGGKCLLVLLVLDVKHTRAACTIGYGLEPFVSPEALDRIAAAALPELQKGAPAGAILAALEAARTELVTVSLAIPRAFGLMAAEDAMAPGSDQPAFAF